MRSRIPSKIIFARCVYYFDRAYYHYGFSMASMEACILAFLIVKRSET